MNKKMFVLKPFCFLLMLSVAFVSCRKKDVFQNSKNVSDKGQRSMVTGVKYNDEDNPGLSMIVNEYEGQPDAPNLIFIEGGRFVMGSSEEDILYTRDNVERTVSIQSFFMDQTEIANIHWLEYMSFYENPENADRLPEGFTDTETYRKQVLLPDTTVWASELAYNDSYVANYLRYPGFRFFPVVGVSWVQAKDFCRWRTLIVNENFAKDAEKEGKIESLPNFAAGEKVPLESGFVVPDYRLPTEAEWEYAAKALVGTQYNDENQSNGRIYPWDGHAVRNPYDTKQYEMGFMLANFKRGRGDYAGIAGKLNDGALITEYIFAYPPNDYGLYNMGGNVSEWVEDVYRPMAFRDVDDLNPVRRQGLDSMRQASDPNRSVYLDPAVAISAVTKNPYNPDTLRPNSLIDDDVRVYKGGSWKDVAYWCSPGTRRFLDKNERRSFIGFRCAMILAGERSGEVRRTQGRANSRK